MANVFLLHLIILLQNVYITMLIYAEGKGSFYLKKCVDCGIVWIGQLLGPNGYLTYNEFKTKFQTVNTNYLLYEGILAAIKDYQKKLNWNELKGSFVVSDTPAWKCLLKNGAKGIYPCLVRNRDICKRWYMCSRLQYWYRCQGNLILFLKLEMPHASDGFSINCYTDYSPLGNFYLGEN